MPMTDLSPDARALLQVIANLHERRTVVTVQAGAIGARLTYMDAYDLVNQLFTSGHLTHDLKVTESGLKAIS
ncbi:hypothetical protein BH23ACT9_BH23ACT9_26230 [soil metagenome]